MIYNDQLFTIENQVDQLYEALKKSRTFQNYLQKKREMYEDKQVQNLRADFIAKKEAFEMIANYGKYAPDRSEKQHAVRKAKRALDLHPKVAEFRYAETELQSILDLIGSVIAYTFSEKVKIDAGNPFFESKTNRGGNCHVG